MSPFAAILSETLLELSNQCGAHSRLFNDKMTHKWKEELMLSQPRHFESSVANVQMMPLNSTLCLKIMSLSKNTNKRQIMWLFKNKYCGIVLFC